MAVYVWQVTTAVVSIFETVENELELGNTFYRVNTFFKFIFTLETHFSFKLKKSITLISL